MVSSNCSWLANFIWSCMQVQLLLTLWLDRMGSIVTAAQPPQEVPPSGVDDNA